MTQEDKQLLLIDLCARLPHRVKVQCGQDKTYIDEVTQINVAKKEVKTVTNTFDVEAVRPILRPMSSMTEEEEIEFINLTDDFLKLGNKHYAILSLKQIDWLNRKMFDYRTNDKGQTMIEAGLALQAKEEMYKMEK